MPRMTHKDVYASYQAAVAREMFIEKIMEDKEK